MYKSEVKIKSELALRHFVSITTCSFFAQTKKFNLNFIIKTVIYFKLSSFIYVYCYIFEFINNIFNVNVLRNLSLTISIWYTFQKGVSFHIVLLLLIFKIFINNSFILYVRTDFENLRMWILFCVGELL